MYRAKQKISEWELFDEIPEIWDLFEEVTDKQFLQYMVEKLDYTLKWFVSPTQADTIVKSVSDLIKQYFKL